MTEEINININPESGLTDGNHIDTIKLDNSGESEKNRGRGFEKYLTPVSILLSGLLISASILYAGISANPKSDAAVVIDQAGNQVKKVDVSVEDDTVLGNKKAKVTIIEFSDYQCPFCRSFWKNTFAALKKDYVDTGKVRLVYRDFPLGFHPAAQASAEAAECADDQGKYWQMHDKIFQEQEKLGQGTVQYGVAELKKWAGELGLDTAKFNSCLDTGKYRAEVKKDYDDGVAAGVEGTPSFFINGEQLVGAQPYETFKAKIDSLLK